MRTLAISSLWMRSFPSSGTTWMYFFADAKYSIALLSPDSSNSAQSLLASAMRIIHRLKFCSSPDFSATKCRKKCSLLLSELLLLLHKKSSASSFSPAITCRCVRYSISLSHLSCLAYAFASSLYLFCE